jgi:hypothetical protein
MVEILELQKNIVISTVKLYLAVLLYERMMGFLKKKDLIN